MHITIHKPNWIIIIGFIFGLCMMLLAAVGVRADTTDLLPAVAPVEVFVVTVDAATDNPHVLKRDTKRLTKQLNQDGYINATAGTQESIELDAIVPSFLLFLQWIIDPLDHAAYAGVLISLVFMDANNQPWLVQQYELDYVLDTPALIQEARVNSIRLSRENLAVDAGTYWLSFLNARLEYNEKVRKEGQSDV